MPRRKDVFTAWRLVPQSTDWDPWDGEGARLYGGRWNPRGVPMVYASSTQALAMLEVLIHLHGLTAKRDYWAYRVTIREEHSQRLDPKALPKNWSSEKPVEALHHIGKAWVDSKSSAVLAVPSALIPPDPDEYNYLINPKHSNFKDLERADPVAITLDPRLLN